MRITTKIALCQWSLPGNSLAIWSLALSFLLCAGCGTGTGLESPTIVKDLRVLAIKLDPPDVELPLGEGTPDIEVRVSALIANPNNQSPDFQLIACPWRRSLGCATWESDDELLIDFFQEIDSGSLEPPPEEQAPQSVINSTLSFSQEIIARLLERASTNALAGARPAFDLAVFSDEEGELAQKRLQLSLPDIVYRMALQEVGIPICDERGQPADCFPFRTKTPNTNPKIEGITYRRHLDNDSMSEPVPFPIEDPMIVEPGERVWIEPIAAVGSSESYQTLMLNFEDLSVRLEDREELLIWSWFATGGSFSRARTEQNQTRGDGNRWRAPSEPGDVWIWLVLRDNRGGVDFRTLHARVEVPMFIE